MDCVQILVRLEKHVHGEVAIQILGLNLGTPWEVAVRHNYAAQMLLHEPFVEVLTIPGRQ